MKTTTKKFPMMTLAVAVAASIALTGVSGYFVLQPGNSEEILQNSAQGKGTADDDTSRGDAQKTVEYTLVGENTTLEIAPGVRVEAWTYNGTIPGPVLRATEGDRVVLHFINKTPMSHTIHLHGDHDEKDDGVFQVVKPGETYTYDFIAGPPGALMYHCHVMPVTQHIRMGLYGALIVDPKEGLSPAREYVLVAGEYDTKDQVTNNPEYVFFNGYADQYWDHPLEVKTNETVRVYYVNMGASPAYGFHIHGTIFDAYASGIWENTPMKVQTWEVAAGNGAIFEAKWPWEGRYLFHLHGLPEEKGTMAYFNVTNAPTSAVDGVDIAKTKSINMIGWQEDLARKLQKQDASGTPSVDASLSESPHGGHQMMDGVNGNNGKEANKKVEAGSAVPVQTNTVVMPKGAAADDSKSFEPSSITVNAGTTVTWRNDDNTFHIVASKAEGVFASDLISQKKTFEHTFAEQGTYDYYCSLHPWMTGTVNVK
ncbi:putative multicopper oxidase [Candidatus Nitrososphaera evergladensis SR1]|uniref:Copper-containing nitrite reductase n=1 Tax=Candidatus Nitrososphaera evergladensis SR1 TaxID=1459636 RepID=A0A075MMC4_9ARCH|nr:multicopper oxidase domain-containing protein [Candidatus Nitrososphaera evergladensis]AIF82285.1 putative multicopper oxidase [Candidatus Nitrososphaera evergladensis SR1]